MKDLFKFINSAKDCSIRNLNECLDKGFDINMEGTNLLIHATIFSDIYSLDYIEELINKGIDINQKTSLNRNALFYAAARGHLDLVKYLVEHNIDINSTDVNGYNALMEVCKGTIVTFPRVVREDHSLLLSSYENRELSSIYGTMYRNRKNRKWLYEKQLEIIKYLLESGIDKTAVVTSRSSVDQSQFRSNGFINSTALDLALNNCYVNDTRMVEMLKSYGVEYNIDNSHSIDFKDSLFEGGIFAFISDLDTQKKLDKKFKAVKKS